MNKLARKYDEAMAAVTLAEAAAKAARYAPEEEAAAVDAWKKVTVIWRELERRSRRKRDA